MGQHARRRSSQAVLDIRQRVLGPEHPDTLSSMSNLAKRLESMGQHAEAAQQPGRCCNQAEGAGPRAP